MAEIVTELIAALPGLSKAVFSQPGGILPESRVSIRPIIIKGQRMYQIERFRGAQAFHENVDEAGLISSVRELEGAFRQVLIVSGEESRQYVLKRNGAYKCSGSAAAVSRPAAEHNRQKEYILSEGEEIPALVDLGVFTKDYKIVKARYDKYRQINRFIQLIDDEFAKSGKKSISILDFGCGKSYLTFILYYYFAVKRGMDTKIIGYDLKRDVVEHCNQVAEKYGYRGLKFVVSDVTKDVLSHEHIDMVVTLHACDIATDYAINYALSRRVEHIFSVPCCQHEINMSIGRGGELDILLRHGIIKERVCALLTDEIRAAVMESEGYSVDVIEFIDFEHSPKNLMLRARRSGKVSAKALSQAKALRETYGFKQSLLDLRDK